MKALFIWLLIAVFAMAETNDSEFVKELPRLVTVDGKSYEHLKDIKVTAARVSFQHESGLASVMLSKLPEDMQKLFRYDAKAAAEELAAERKAAAKYYTAVSVAAADTKAGKDTKAAALLKAQYIGSDKYNLSPHNVKNSHDFLARKALIDAGYGMEEAAKIVKDLRHRK